MQSGEPTTYAEVVLDRVERSPDRTAFTFVEEDGSETSVDYLGLYAEARGIAEALRAAGCGPGEPVVLLLPPGLGYVAGLFACLLSGMPAVPAFPPDPYRLDRSMSRIGALLRDSTARVVLTIDAVVSACGDLIREASGCEDLRFLVADGIEPSTDSPHVLPEPSAPALLQYTSGSTALPRGVVVTQANMAANCALIHRALGMNEENVGVSWLPPYHDMGLVGFILEPVYACVPAVLMSPTMFVRRPISWLQTITRHRGDTSAGPNFAYDLCVRRIKPEDRAELDLSCWTLAASGAEPVRPDTLAAFAEAFGEVGFDRRAFYPCYGLAEATLQATGGTRFDAPRVITVAADCLARDARAVAANGGPQRSLVSVGTPDPGAELEIVDVETARVLGEGEVGEIWLRGPSVTAGYWGRERESDESFRAFTADDRGPFLRTGDLGFTDGGELFVTGRMKDVMIINGQNVHPPEVELACERAVKGLRRGCGAAFGVPSDAGDERVAVVYEVRGDDPDELSEIIGGVRRAVAMEVSSEPEAIVLVEPRSIAKTSSGKLQRWLVRQQYMEGRLPSVAAWSRSEPVQAQAGVPA